MFQEKILLKLTILICLILQISKTNCSLSSQKKGAENGDNSASSSACINCTVICPFPCHAPPKPPPPPPYLTEAPPPPSGFHGPPCPPGSIPCCQYPNGTPFGAGPFEGDQGQYVPPSPYYTYVPYNNFSASISSDDYFGMHLFSAFFFMYVFLFYGLVI
ncbi:unnamed protein product [Amaranthus hypochondriacus]